MAGWVAECLLGQAGLSLWRTYVKQCRSCVGGRSFDLVGLVFVFGFVAWTGGKRRYAKAGRGGILYHPHCLLHHNRSLMV